jgi:hydroxymethylglutaryl-CoA reductase (NADPH)
MPDSVSNKSNPLAQPPDIVPRMKEQGYVREDVARRREWIEARVGCRLQHVGAHSIPSEEMCGNIENPIGAAQIPIGVAGPLVVQGGSAHGTFYVPMATTEGALIRSYERGMVTLTRSGGVNTQVVIDENLASPVFFFENVNEASEFARSLPDEFDAIRAAAESTTRHGKLRRIECHQVGREVMIRFYYFTGDAHGMNMIVKATEEACEWIMCRSRAKHFYIFSGLCSEKQASGALLAGGKGKKVIAGAHLPADIVRRYLHATPRQLFDVWLQLMLGHIQVHTAGHSSHFANGLAAIFIACGQDVANITNSAVGFTNFEITDGGDLYASVTLPALIVATVGGGTSLGTNRECLEMLGCAGSGKAAKFAEIVAASLLAGELSLNAAIASGEFVAAHEAYGRNRPR